MLYPFAEKKRKNGIMISILTPRDVTKNAEAAKHYFDSLSYLSRYDLNILLWRMKLVPKSDLYGDLSPHNESAVSSCEFPK